MPRPLIALHGTPEYDAALRELQRRVARTVPEVRDRSALTELAVTRLAEAYGLTMPRRSRPPGTNRYTR